MAGLSIFDAGGISLFGLYWKGVTLDAVVAKGTWTASGTWTIPAVTLGGAVAGGDQAFTNVGDMTFATGSILASGSTNGNTLLLRANDTTFITLTTGATDVCTLDAITMSGTWLASGTVTLPAVTLGGVMTLSDGEYIVRGVTNSYLNIHGGTGVAGKGGILQAVGSTNGSNPGAVQFYTPNAAQSGNLMRLLISGVAATAKATWEVVYHEGMKFGLAGTATGAWTMDGATSGVVTVTVAAAAGTWTMTLPTGVAGTAGFQLTDAGADGVCSWSGAGSLREYKNILGVANPQDALDKILGTRVYRFHYKEGKGTQDRLTEYFGPVAEEAPWATHYNGSVLNPVNALGFSILGIQALNEKIQRLENRLEKVGA